MKFHNIKASHNETLKSTINGYNTKKYHEQITQNNITNFFWHYDEISELIFGGKEKTFKI